VWIYCNCCQDLTQDAYCSLVLRFVTVVTCQQSVDALPKLPLLLRITEFIVEMFLKSSNLLGIAHFIRCRPRQCTAVTTMYKYKLRHSILDVVI
jgi:hypothetical protein